MASIMPVATGPRSSALSRMPAVAPSPATKTWTGPAWTSVPTGSPRSPVSTKPPLKSAWRS